MTKTELFLAWKKAKKDWLDAIKNREKNSPYGGQWIQEMYRGVCEAEHTYLSYIREHADEIKSEAERKYMEAVNNSGDEGFQKWFERKLSEPY